MTLKRLTVFTLRVTLTPKSFACTLHENLLAFSFTLACAFMGKVDLKLMFIDWFVKEDVWIVAATTLEAASSKACRALSVSPEV